MYRLFFDLVLRRLPAETAHRLAFGALRLLATIPGVLPLMRLLLAPRHPALQVEAFGKAFPGPLGLAAGFDKDAEGFEALAALGFGSVEIGTVTPRPQPGNPRPRMFRLVNDRALINRMGFNNAGAEAAAVRLRRPRRAVVGVNIGKNKEVPEAEAAGEYARGASELAGLADYLVVNVSSPNTPGLRDLQAVDVLRPLLKGVLEASEDVPLLVKIAPDLADEDILAVVDLALELGIQGIIATNTTVSQAALSGTGRSRAAEEEGGLSGRPLRGRSEEVLRLVRARAGDRLTLVSAGGIEHAGDAWLRIKAGATLVQGYTGLIYGGPLWAHRIHRDLVRLARREGYLRVQDAVGASLADR